MRFGIVGALGTARARRAAAGMAALGESSPGCADGCQGRPVLPDRCYVCLDLGAIASEDLCGEGGHSSGRSEAP
jgi:hypothetical protein